MKHEIYNITETYVPKRENIHTATSHKAAKEIAIKMCEETHRMAFVVYYIGKEEMDLGHAEYSGWTNEVHFYDDRI